jgi:hypothetical protein
MTLLLILFAFCLCFVSFGASGTESLVVMREIWGANSHLSISIVSEI